MAVGLADFFPLPLPLPLPLPFAGTISPWLRRRVCFPTYPSTDPPTHQPTHPPLHLCRCHSAPRPGLLLQRRQLGASCLVGWAAVCVFANCLPAALGGAAKQALCLQVLGGCQEAVSHKQAASCLVVRLLQAAPGKQGGGGEQGAGKGISPEAPHTSAGHTR